MTDDFGTAEIWAKKAEMFFQNASPAKYKKEIKYLNKYIEGLQERRITYELRGRRVIRNDFTGNGV
jgi:hypothetical protein